MQTLTRRSMLGRMTGALAMPAALSLLAACGGDDDDEGSNAEPTADAGEDPTSTTASEAMSTPDSDPTSTESPATAAKEREPTTEEQQGEEQVEGPLIIASTGSEFQDHYNSALRHQPSYHYTMAALMFRGLTFIDPANDFAVDPALAETIEVSDDGLVYTVTLQDGLLWPDGEPFTVDDVIFTLDMILNPDLAANSSVEFGALASYTSVDERTIELTLSQPHAPFMQTLAFHVVPQHKLEGQDPVEGEFAQSSPMGMGPYVITEIRRGELITLEANPNYYRGLPNIRTLLIRAFGDSAGALAALRTNEVHVVELQPNQVATVDTDVYNLAHAWGASPNSIAFNFMHEMWADPAPRQALNWAINREAVVDQLLQGNARPASGPLPGSSWEDASLEPYTLDQDKVDELMTEAGWVRNGDDIWEKDGTTFTFNLIAPGFLVDAATIWADDLKRAGFDPILDTTRDYSWVFQNFDESHAVTWNFGVPSDPDSIYLALHSNAFPEMGGFNLYYSNTDVDAGLDAGRTSMTTDERRDAYNAVQTTLRDDPAYLWGYAANPIVAIDQRVSGWNDDLGTHSQGMAPLVTNIAEWNLSE